jgi:hypothetical protein
MGTKRGSVVECETFKITRSGDGRCWIYEQWRVGGIDRKTGKVSEGNWYTVGYYGQLSDLVIYLVNRHIEVPDGTLQTQMKDLLIEVKRVESSILEQLKAHD